jgi:hypothetical protein
MKLNDIINEEPISEIPLGVGATLKTAVKSLNPFSTSGRNKAQGQLASGANANQIYGQFHNWLGQTGKTADANTVIEFLKQHGYGQRAIDAAQQIISKLPKTTNEATGPGALLTPRPKTNFGGGQTAAPPPSQVNYSSPPSNKAKPIPLPTSTQGPYSAKNAFSTPTATTPAAPIPQQPKALDKSNLNAIFLAVAQSQPPQQQQPRQQQPAGQPSASYGVSGQPSTSGAAPTIDVPSIVTYYKSLPDDNSRQALRVQLDQADAELSKANPDFVSEVRENEGFSRYLGIAL